MKKINCDKNKTKSIENKISKLHESRKQSYIDERGKREKIAVSKIDSDSQYFFKYANNFKRVSSSPSILLDSSKNIVNDSTTIANLLQSHFKSVFSTPISDYDASKLLSSPEINDKLPDFSISVTDIINAINEIKSSSACPKSCIPAKIFKLCKFSLAKPLKLFWEKSFCLGEIPEEYKMQQIVPLHKKGSKANAANYRPIALTSHVIKIFERVLRNKLMDYLEQNKIINNNQHGFRKGHSCLSQLLSHTTFILDQMNQGNDVDTIYVDYSKAFDKVDHGILLKKLKLYGIEGKYHAWLSNFLQERKQFVCVKDSVSYLTDVVSGVPQGSVLGPLLFVLYINDMANSIKSSELQTFVDDTKIAHPIQSIADKELLQKDLNHMKSWSEDNNMQLNQEKFELICHSTTRKKPWALLKELPFFYGNFSYEASNNIQLVPKTAVRDLGIIMDPMLDWKSHIEKISLDCRKLTGWILNVFITREKQTMMLLFNSLIRSRLEFCCELWDPYLIKYISKIEQIQRRFTSKIDGGKDLTYWERLKTFKISSLQRRRERQTIIYVWKIRNNFVRNDVNLQFIKCPRTSREKVRLQPMPRTTGKKLSIFENSFVIRAAKLWNKVPLQLAAEKSLNIFKSNLNKWLLSFPDKPPVHGYYHVCKNSILDYNI